jgi:hypothetical protein
MEVRVRGSPRAETGSPRQWRLSWPNGRLRNVGPYGRLSWRLLFLELGSEAVRSETGTNSSTPFRDENVTRLNQNTSITTPQSVAPLSSINHSEAFNENTLPSLTQ